MTQKTIKYFIEEFYLKPLKKILPQTKQTFIILMTFRV